MAYVIAEPCIGVKDTRAWRSARWIASIRPRTSTGSTSSQQLYIDPAECIDCDACVEACPVDAIFAEDQVPAEWEHYIDINAAYYRNGGA